MKYIRKAIVIMLVAVFLAAVAIGASVVLAVRNVNVAVVSYFSSAGISTDFTEAVSEIKSSLSSLTGKNILSVGESNVQSLISQSGYARYVSTKKIYPCTVNVTVKERLETFTVVSGDGSYLVYDELGEYVVTKESNVNNLDGCPNVLVSAEEGDLAAVAQAAALFKEEFSALRSVVKSITVTGYAAENSDVLAFTLYCGATLRLVNYTEYPQEKIAA